MLNIIIVIDDHDDLIGDNCKLSYDYLTSKILPESYNIILLTGELCKQEHVNKAIASFNNERFILIAYSHGQSHALVSTYAQDGYVTLETASHFKSSLVYTNSCLTGLELMKALIQHECSGYVGYTGRVRVPSRKEDEIIFIACENVGLINFLTTNDSLTESIEVMRNFYSLQVKEFSRKKRYILAGRLQRNLSSLVHYDENAIKRGDFLVDLKSRSVI